MLYFCAYFDVIGKQAMTPHNMTNKERYLGIVKIISLIIGIFAGIATIIGVVIAILPEKDDSIDLSGCWEMTFKIESSELAAHKNGKLEYKYRLTFNQKGSNIEGVGEKFWEKINGVEVFYNRNQKTPILINGKIEKNILSATISEEGMKRKTTGFIEFEIIEKSIDRIQGKFKTTAANSSGVAILEKNGD